MLDVQRPTKVLDTAPIGKVVCLKYSARSDDSGRGRAASARMDLMLCLDRSRQVSVGRFFSAKTKRNEKIRNFSKIDF